MTPTAPRTERRQADHASSSPYGCAGGREHAVGCCCPLPDTRHSPRRRQQPSACPRASHCEPAAPTSQRRSCPGDTTCAKSPATGHAHFSPHASARPSIGNGKHSPERNVRPGQNTRPSTIMLDRGLSSPKAPHNTRIHTTGLPTRRHHRPVAKPTQGTAMSRAKQTQKTSRTR